MQSIRFSIIIPSRNGKQYLTSCVQTIIDQNYDNYELIISDDHSEDGTKDYLKSLEHNNKIKLLEPPVSLSMTEHWEWALSHACGEWLIFVGQDDGLQPYFFTLAERLIEMAHKENLRLIMSERAYYFWSGCEFVYGDIAVDYNARNAVKIHNCQYEAIKALLGIQSYFNLPQMYTTSLFHRDIISEAKIKQQGRLLLTHPQDANLAAIACSLDHRYLKSYIPLGWVGSSLKSAGMAVTSNETGSDATDESKDLKMLKNEYLEKIHSSYLEYNGLAGDFSFANLSIYFWQSFLQTQNLRSNYVNRILMSKVFKTILFSQVLNEVNSADNSNLRLQMFKEILKRNQCSFVPILLGSKVYALIITIILMFNRMTSKAHRLISNRITYTIQRSDNPDMDIIKASKQVDVLLTEKKWLNTQY